MDSAVAELIDFSRKLRGVSGKMHSQLQQYMRASAEKERRNISREFAKTAGIPPKLADLRTRVFERGRGKKAAVKLWVGYNSVAYKHIGQPVRAPGGLKVGTQYIRGGFVGKHGHIYKRVGKARLPIKRLEVYLAAPISAMEKAARRLNADISAKAQQLAGGSS